MANVTNRVNTIFTADGTGVAKTVAGIQGAVTGLKGKLAGAFGAITLGAIVHSMLEFGDGIQTMSEQLNISTDSAQQFSHAIRNSNIEAGSLRKTLGAFDDLMGDWANGSLDENKKNILRKLGISEKDLDLKPDDLLKKALGSTKELPKKQVQDLFEGLGITKKAASQVVGGRDDILDNSIPIVSQKDIAALDLLGDTFADLKNAIVVALIPAMLWAAEALLSTFKGTVDYFDSQIKKDKSMSAQAEKDGANRGGWLAKGAAIITDTVQNAAVAGLDAIGKNDAAMKVDSFMEDRKNTFLYGKNWRSYVDKASTDAAKPSELSLKLEELLKKINKVPDKKDDFARNRENLNKQAFQNNIGQLGGNPFMSMGNLMGADLQYRIQRLSEEANAYLKQIVINTTPTNKPTEEPQPSSP